MSYAEPRKLRAQIEEAAEGLTVTIPAQRHWFVVMFLSVWLMGWLAGEAAVTKQLYKEISKALAGEQRAEGWGAMGFMLLWLVMWTVGGLFALGTVLYMFFGAEVIEVDSQGVVRRWRPFPWPRPKRYLAAYMSDLRARPGSGEDERQEHSGPTPGRGGRIAFDYREPGVVAGVGENRGDNGNKGQVVYLGSGLTEPEAEEVIKAIVQRLPSLEKRPEEPESEDEYGWR